MTTIERIESKVSDFLKSPKNLLIDGEWQKPKAQKTFIKIAKNKKNYFVLDSSLNNSNLEKKIFEIVCKYLKIK